MERSEPVFVPEWTRTQNGSFTIISASNNRSTLNADDQGNRPSSKQRTSLSGIDHVLSHTYSFPTRASSSSCRRSVGNRDRDVPVQSRIYSNFYRNHRDRGQEKNLEYNEKGGLHLVGDEYIGHPDSLPANRTERDSIHSSNNGRRSEVRPRMSVNDGLLSGNSSANNISKTSFERDFPSLGTKEKQSPKRVSSPGSIMAAQSLPLSSSSIMSGNSWTSALVDVPATTLGSRPGQQSLPVCLPVNTSCTSTGLNMAETLAQAPARVRTPQLSLETQKLEELAIKQSRQLIPVTPSTPKASTLSSSEKLKPKGARVGDMTVLSKVVQQSSLQTTNHIRGIGKSDVSKPSQIGNFQVLNRDRNGVSSTIKEVQSPTNAGKVMNLFGSVSASALKVNNDSKSVVKSLTKSSSMEKKSSSQAQNRNEFFKTIRNSKSANHSPASQEQFPVISSSKPEMTAHCADNLKNNGTSDSLSESKNYSYQDFNGVSESGSSTNEQLRQHISCIDGIVDPDEEEVRFLRSLGWEENAGEDALTAEEIEAFKKKYMKVSSLPKVGNLDMLKPEVLISEGDASPSELCSSLSF